ncbi:MAG TPA: J domain-containing protein [Polyangia bacterium]|nr:J domain-containing protein [Polyangia bacterium]
MSIGRRLIDLARAELNSLLDRAARADEDDDFGSSTEHLSDRELEEELERRRQARQEAERAAQGPRRTTSTRTGEPLGDGPGGRRRPEFRRASSDDTNAVRRAYAALEVPAGSNFETVRRAYRTLMRKYHPDLHTSTPEKQKAANEITQKLTDSYKLLEKRLRR